MSRHGRYAPNYVYIDKPPGLIGSAWWVASIGLIVDQPVGLLFNERTLGLSWWELPLGIVSWLVYSLWRVESTHMWQSDLAHAILARWFYRRYPTSGLATTSPPDLHVAAGSALSRPRIA